MSQIASSDNSPEIILPWYRQFWFWFVFGPLIFIIILCGFTVTIALKNADDVIVDNYYKQGRMINQTLDQDKRAKALGLAADLRFDLETGDVLLSIPSSPSDGSPLPDTLLLFMGHPVKAANDQQVLLRAIVPGQYRGEVAQRPNYHWYLTLYAASTLEARNDAPWTLSGEINFSQGDNARLEPRIEE